MKCPKCGRDKILVEQCITGFPDYYVEGSKIYYCGFCDIPPVVKLNAVFQRKVKFCWHCGRKLWGNHFKEVLYEGHKRICHKECAKELEKMKEEGQFYEESPFDLQNKNDYLK